MFIDFWGERGGQRERETLIGSLSLDQTHTLLAYWTTLQPAGPLGQGCAAGFYGKNLATFE